MLVISYSGSIPDAIQRLHSRDLIFKELNLEDRNHTDAEVAELVDCLLAHPDIITHMRLLGNRLTDETGVKLARYVAASSTIKWLELSYNQFGSATYLALAAALRVNSSLERLYLCENPAINIEDQSRVDMAFVDALILNPARPFYSAWYLYSHSNILDRLKKTADRLGHPSLQVMLATRMFGILN